MKVIRFSGWGKGLNRHSSYGYIRANWFERRAIRKRISAGDTRIYEAPEAYGPRTYGAQFIVSGRFR